MIIGPFGHQASILYSMNLVISFSLFISILKGFSSLFLSEPSIQKINIVAHRGAHTNLPENTIQAFEEAIEIGVDYIEVDLRTTKNGHLAVFHDRSLDRMTGTQGNFSNYDLKELQSMPLFHQGELSNEYRIPTFEEVLKISKGRVKIYLDFKSADVQQTWKLIQKFGMEDQILVYVNDPLQQKDWRKTAPHVSLMMSLPDSVQNRESLKNFINQTDVDYFDGRCQDYTPEMIQTAQCLGKEIWIDIQSPNESPEIWESCIKKGVNALQTDHPRKLMEYLISTDIRTQ